MRFVGSLKPQGMATVVGLYGELGAGKTEFTKGIAERLGIKEYVTSPTFILERVYKLEGSAYKHLIHIDAYRLSGSDELHQLGWEEIVKEPSNLIVIEWADRIENALPKNTHKIFFESVGENIRDITYG